MKFGKFEIDNTTFILIVSLIAWCLIEIFGKR